MMLTEPRSLALTRVRPSSRETLRTAALLESTTAQAEHRRTLDAVSPLASEGAFQMVRSRWLSTRRAAGSLPCAIGCSDCINAAVHRQERRHARADTGV